MFKSLIVDQGLRSLDRGSGPGVPNLFFFRLTIGKYKLYFVSVPKNKKNQIRLVFTLEDFLFSFAIFLLGNFQHAP